MYVKESFRAEQFHNRGHAWLASVTQRSSVCNL